MIIWFSVTVSQPLLFIWGYLEFPFILTLLNLAQEMTFLASDAVELIFQLFLCHFEKLG